MTERDLARLFYMPVMIKERERRGYCDSKGRWFNEEPTFDNSLINDVILICGGLANQFIKIEHKIALDNFENTNKDI